MQICLCFDNENESKSNPGSTFCLNLLNSQLLGAAKRLIGIIDDNLSYLFNTSFPGGFGELLDPATLAEDERALGHDYLARALREDAVPARLQRDDGAHGLASRVEGVDFREGGVRVGLPDLSVVLAQVHDEAQQGTFRLVTDLNWQLVGILGKLENQ